MQLWMLIAVAAMILGGDVYALPQSQDQAQQAQAPQEPPEEDESAKPKEYDFNPLQASKEMKVGEFYFKKKSYRAAASRFSEATKWDPSNADAFLRWGESLEKLKDKDGAREAYRKYVELQPESKTARDLKKRWKL
jgi:tetratricopeptide (TPR) repeat protein